MLQLMKVTKDSKIPVRGGKAASSEGVGRRDRV